MRREEGGGDLDDALASRNLFVFILFKTADSVYSQSRILSP